MWGRVHILRRIHGVDAFFLGGFRESCENVLIKGGNTFELEKYAHMNRDLPPPTMAIRGAVFW